jgi:hypothetical protein
MRGLQSKEVEVKRNKATTFVMGYDDIVKQYSVENIIKIADIIL